MQNEQKILKNGSGHKNIVIFHVTSMSTDYDAYTNSLAIKMDKFAKKNNIDVFVKMDSASKIYITGKEADIILLTPELFEAVEEVKVKFPNKVVKVIDQKDYGFMDAENIMKMALS